MPPAAPTIIREEHRALSSVIRSLQHLAREGARGDAELDHDLFTVMLDYIDAFPNRYHHPKEDEYLFRALRRRTLAGAAVLDELEAEHARGDALIRELRHRLARCRVGGRPAREAFAAAVDEYAAFHWEHLRKEEDLVLPLAEAHLTPADWEEIDRVFRANDDPLFGAEPRAHFRSLFRLIVNRAPPPVGVGPARPDAPGRARSG
jgi:hemerythrin-like domain-containing protein